MSRTKTTLSCMALSVMITATAITAGVSQAPDPVQVEAASTYGTNAATIRVVNGVALNRRVDDGLRRHHQGKKRRQSGRPNIVMVMADDMRVDDLRFAPTIRALASQGVSFRNSFSPYPLCCPARASFLSGQYAHNHKVFSHVEPFGFGAFDDSHTLAGALRGAGYRTAFVGKYLNGYGTQRSRVNTSKKWQWVPPGWTDWYGALEDSPGSPAVGSTYNYFQTPYNINGRVDNSHGGEYQTHTLGKFARDLTTKYAKKSDPFFLYLSSVAPHHGGPREPDDPASVRRSDGVLQDFPTPARPGSVKGKFNKSVTRAPGVLPNGTTETDMADKQPTMRNNPELSTAEALRVRDMTRQRGEAIWVLDQQVEALVKSLKASGEWSNTVFMFTSDNGYFLGEHRLRSGKIRAYEPSLRVPLIMTGPGIGRGDRFDPIMTPDITATILDIAGATAGLTKFRAADGHSMRAVAAGAERGWVTPVLTEGLIGNPLRSPKNQSAGFNDVRDTIGVRTSRYLFLRDATGWTELYDLNRDPNQLTSVAGDPAYAAVQDQLRAVWDRLKDCAGPGCQVPLPAALQAPAATNRANATAQLAGISRFTGTTW